MKSIVSKCSRIFCKPLDIHFPQIYRLQRTRPISTGQTRAASGEWPVRGHPEFSLSGEVSLRAGIAAAEPIGHLAPADEKSLVLRHHWSRSRAQTYLQGVEDNCPDQLISGVFVADGAFFTLTQRATSGAWNGPTIFYLADLFEDDDFLSVQNWEMSAACDGTVERTDIFCDG